MDRKRNDVKDEIETSFKGLIQNLTVENYTENYFPFIAETRKVLNSLEDSKNGIRDTIIKTDHIISEIKPDDLN